MLATSIFSISWNVFTPKNPRTLYQTTIFSYFSKFQRDNIFKSDENCTEFSKWVENTVGKVMSNFSFSTVFSKDLYCKHGLVWERITKQNLTSRPYSLYSQISLAQTPRGLADLFELSEV